MRRKLFALFVILSLFTFCKEKGQPTDNSGTTETASTDEGVNQEGKKIFLSTCATCHGPTGLGDGAASAGLKPKPRNFQKEKFAYGGDLASIKKTIMNGSPKSPLMAAFKNVLKPEQIDAVADYVLYLSKKGKQ